MGTQTIANASSQGDPQGASARMLYQQQQPSQPPPVPPKRSTDMFRVARKPLPSPHLDSPAPMSRPASLTPAATASTPSLLSTVLQERRRSALATTTPARDTQEDSVYYQNYAMHLESDRDSTKSSSSSMAGKRFWSKPKTNEKWKELNEKYDSSKPKQGKKLWGKIVKASQNMADRLPSLRDDRGPESDESDWEGETHVSRVIREYYEKKREPLPGWLSDERTVIKPLKKQQHKSHEMLNLRTRRKPKLWEVEDRSNNHLTSSSSSNSSNQRHPSSFLQPNPSRESLTTYSQRRNISYDATYETPSSHPVSRTSWAAGQPSEFTSPSSFHTRPVSYEPGHRASWQQNPPSTTGSHMPPASGFRDRVRGPRQPPVHQHVGNRYADQTGPGFF